MMPAARPEKKPTRMLAAGNALQCGLAITPVCDTEEVVEGGFPATLVEMVGEAPAVEVAAAVIVDEAAEGVEDDAAGALATH